MSKPKTDARRPCIYVAQSATTRKCYVGQSTVGVVRRKRQHKHSMFKSTTKFATALRELGWDDFQWEVVYVVREELDKETLQDLLNEKERFYVKYYNSFAEGYNSSKGGEGSERRKFNSLEEKRIARNKRKRELRNENREEYREKRKQYRLKLKQTNPEKLKQKEKAYREKNKSRLKEQRERRKYGDLEKHQQWLDRTREQRKKRNHLRRQNMSIEQRREYYLKHQERKRKRKLMKIEVDQS